MTTFFQRFSLTVLLVSLALVRPASAAFNPHVVAAEAQWVVYADLNGLRGSTLGREIMATVQRQMPTPPPSVTGIEFDFQMLLATIGNVTAYGTNFSVNNTMIDGALVVEGTGELRRIAEGWLAQATLTNGKGVTEAKGLPFPGYMLGNELYVGFPTEPVILLSKSAAQLVKARDVFRGSAPSLAQTPGAPLAQLLAKSGNAYGVAAGILPAEAIGGTGPQARILQLVSSGILTLGEENQRTLAHGELNAKSASDAEKLLKIVQGLTAMASLTETNDRQLAEFLQSAVIERQDRIVTLDVSYSSERLAQMIQFATQRKQPTTSNAANFGTVLGEWKLDQAAPNTPPSAALLSDKVFASVHLTTGTTLTLTGQRGARGEKGGTAAIDCVEIFPMSGGAGLRFEAENMRLRGYMIRKAPFASGGFLIGHLGYFASAQFEFPGSEGDYMVKVRYLEETTGNTTLAVSVREPDAAAPLRR